MLDVLTSESVVMSDVAEADDRETVLVSLRLSPEIARAFKIEAARRGVRLNALFAEVWRSYEEAALGSR